MVKPGTKRGHTEVSCLRSVASSAPREASFALMLAILAACIASFAGCATTPDPVADFAASADFKDLDAAVEERVSAGRYPGAVFVVANADRVLHVGAVGFADVEHQTPVRSDAIFRMMSMTKPVTTVAVMMLVDDGKVVLDDPVSRYLPEFLGYAAQRPTDPTPITVRQLLTHTSGLGFGSMLISENSLSARTAKIASSSLKGVPGKKWEYSGLDGFDILARIVEVASGKSYESFLKQRLFDPLEMKDTTYVLSASQQSRLVGLYKPEKGKFVRGTSPLPDVRYPSGGAGLYSSAADFTRFAQMLAGRGASGSVRILTTQAVDEMSRAQLPVGFPGLAPGLAWGLGVREVADPALANSPLPVGAYGWSGAYGTHFWVDPEHKLTAVFLTNVTTAGGAGSPDALDFERFVTRTCESNKRCGR